MSVMGQKRTWPKQKDRLAGGLSKKRLWMHAGQPGHSDRPVQDPRVKLACTFAAVRTCSICGMQPFVSATPHAVPYLAALGNKVVIRIDNQKCGEFSIVRQTGHS